MCYLRDVLHLLFGPALHLRLGNALHSHVNNTLYSFSGNALYLDSCNALHPLLGNVLHLCFSNALHLRLANALNLCLSNALHIHQYVIVLVPTEYLIYASDTGLHSLDLSGGSSDPLPSISTGQVNSFDIDYNRNIIYYVNDEPPAVHSVEWTQDGANIKDFFGPGMNILLRVIYLLLILFIEYFTTQS